MKKFYFFVITAIVLTVMVSSSWAKMQWVNRVPNTVKFGCGNCHVNLTGGGARNPFGREIEWHFIEDDNVIWQTALAIIDSDDDGKTNGEELLDPNGSWRIDDPPPGDFTNVTNPGVFDNLLAPTLQSPTDKYIGVPLTTQFVWSPVTGAENYRLEFSEDINFATVSKVLDSIKTTLATKVELLPNKDYYWRVRAQASFAVSSWSPVFNFKSRLAVPAPVAPVNNASGMKVPTKFNWNFVDGAFYYFLEISTSTDFSSPVVAQYDLTDTTTTILELAVNKTYYWRVRADDAPQLSDWSPTMKFDTKLPGPALVAPVKDSIWVEPNAILTWNKLESSSSYNIQIDTSNAFAQPAIIRNNVTDTTVVIEALENDRVYFWRVNVGVEPNVGQWSETWSFRVKPTAPTLDYPENEAQDLPYNFLAKWNPVNGAESYGVQLASDVEFSNVIKNMENIPGAQSEFSELNPGAQYFWRVRAIKGTAVTDWSAARSFTTGLGAPYPLQPENGATDQPLTLILNWGKVPTAVDYSVQVARDENFSDIYREELNIADTTLTLPGLPEETTFYWRVRSNLPGGASPWSETRDFTTRKEGSASDFIAKDLSLTPNPVADIIIFQGTFENTLNIEFYVVDLLGKVCLELGSKEFSIGLNQAKFDVKELAPGSYRLILQKGSHIRSLPFIKS